MSSLHLFMITPFGVVSKKLIGLRNTLWITWLNRMKLDFELNIPNNSDLRIIDVMIIATRIKKTSPYPLSSSLVNQNHPLLLFAHSPAQKLDTWIARALTKNMRIARSP